MRRVLVLQLGGECEPAKAVPRTRGAVRLVGPWRIGRCRRRQLAEGHVRADRNGREYFLPALGFPSLCTLIPNPSTCHFSLSSCRFVSFVSLVSIPLSLPLSLAPFSPPCPASVSDSIFAPVSALDGRMRVPGTGTPCANACRRWWLGATTSPRKRARGWCTPPQATGRRTT